MNGGGRRQLPSWMLRPCTAEQTSVSEVKEENNENHQVELVAETQKKVKRKEPKPGVQVVDNKSRILKKCEGRTRHQKSGHEDEEQQENEPDMIKQRRTRKSKRMFERGKDQDCETDDASMRKKCRVNTLGKKKTNKFLEDSDDGRIPSEDELTVEDLVSIAEEYVNADMREPENRQFESEMRSSVAEVDSEMDLTAHKDEKLHIYKPLPAECTSSYPLSGDGSINCPIDTFDPARDMLELLCGGLLRKFEVERKNDVVTENLMLDYDRCKRSQNESNTIAEVVPVTKKKGSLKDKVAMLLE